MQSRRLSPEKKKTEDKNSQFAEHKMVSARNRLPVFQDHVTSSLFLLLKLSSCCKSYQFPKPRIPSKKVAGEGDRLEVLMDNIDGN